MLLTRLLFPTLGKPECKGDRVRTEDSYYVLKSRHNQGEYIYIMSMEVILY